MPRHCDGFQREVGRRLVGQQAGQFAGDLAELLGGDLGFAQQADLVLDQRVTDVDDGHGDDSRLGSV
jgi:hypothetical protein